MFKRFSGTGAALRFLGAAILLLSLVAQNFLYDRSDARQAELVGALRDRQLLDKGALLNEVLHFSALNSANATSEISAAELASGKASLAAQKVAQSASIAINVARVAAPEEAVQLDKVLFERASKVGGYPELLAFISFVDTAFGHQTAQINAQYAQEQNDRRQLRLVFLALHVAGALLLLAGLLLEWIGAARQR